MENEILYGRYERGGFDTCKYKQKAVKVKEVAMSDESTLTLFL